MNIEKRILKFELEAGIEVEAIINY